MVKIVECSRDAMQGIHHFIPTQTKIEYNNLLLKVGFDTLDFGSFVSPKAIPQMRDTANVLEGLDLESTDTKLLAIIANKRGAVDALQFEQINFLGFPFSVSETFQIRNTNATLSEAIGRVAEIQELCVQANREMVVYLSMGFGNPYGDPWNAEIVMKWVEKLSSLGIRILALSDTIGVSSPDNISYLFENLIPAYPDIEFGAHLHTRKDNWKPKVAAAISSGCRRIDGAIQGYGGCPMAKDELTGNMPTEFIIDYLREEEMDVRYDMSNFQSAMNFTPEVFLSHDDS